MKYLWVRVGAIGEGMRGDGRTHNSEVLCEHAFVPKIEEAREVFYQSVLAVGVEGIVFGEHGD